VKRALAITVVLTAAAVIAFLAIRSGGSGSPTYWVELDNAFGLTSGADVKVAGVRAGKIDGFKLDTKTYYAKVQIELSQQGFDRFRSDVFCESRPQSLIGEYFLDCQPGAHGKLLRSGATIPVSHTSTTIAPDLIADTLRVPEQERLRIIINELGAGVAGNGQNLNDAIRRAVPALTQTDRVLAILAQQNKVIANLVHDGDTVVTALSNNRRNVGRFVTTARNTAEASAARRAALAATFRKLPAFLAELRPAMAALGQTAVSQTGALRNLDAESGQLNTFLKLLGPFADASRPALRTLADASRVGRFAVKTATPVVDLLNQFATTSPEVSANLRIILEHLDDPSHAVETDKRAGPQHTDGRQNYTGLEALLQYVYDQSQAANVYDGVEYILKIAGFADPDCSPYNDGHKLRNDDAAAIALYQKCSGNKIGPNGPGLLGHPNVSDTGQYPPEHGTPGVAIPPTGGGPELSPPSGSSAPTPPSSPPSLPSGGGSPVDTGGGSTPPTNAVDPVTTIVGQAANGGGSNSGGGTPNPPAAQAPNVPANTPTAPNTSNVPNAVQQGVQGALPTGGGGRDRTGADRSVMDYLMGP
jgi:phospholipid/cholesterol/gamma-HCH transport system substrate-binding protein